MSTSVEKAALIIQLMVLEEAIEETSITIEQRIYFDDELGFIQQRIEAPRSLNWWTQVYIEETQEEIKRIKAGQAINTKRHGFDKVKHRLDDMLASGRVT